jgi:hypothetical protein
MKTPQSHNPLTDTQLDAALSAAQDQILPSSGFADAVMTAVRAEAAAPAPIAFPWKRAVPGMVGVIAAFALLVIVIVAFLRRIPASAAGRSGAATNWTLDLTPLLHHAAGIDVAWMALALAIPLVCLIALRRVIFSR